MAISLSPIDTLKGWGEALQSPLGIILLVGVAIYIFLRVTGRLDNPLGGLFGKKGGGNSGNNGGGRQPDYIIK